MPKSFRGRPTDADYLRYKIVALSMRGLTTTEIGLKVGITAAAVERIIAGDGADKPDRPLSKEEQLQKIYDKALAGETDACAWMIRRYWTLLGHRVAPRPGRPFGS